MPASRYPGSLGQTEGLVNIDPGTLARVNTQRPGAMGAQEDSWWDRYFGHHISTWQRARCLMAAYETARARAPEEIEKEIPGVKQVLSGVLQGMLQMLLVVGVTTTVGAAVGGVIGAFFGGVGAAPGAVVGGELGLDAGLAVLTWLGVAFLLASIVSDLGQLTSLVESAATRAWKAAEYSEPLRTQETRGAGMELARAVAVLVRLIFEAIVAYLLKKGGKITSETVGELVARLRKSRFGVALAEYVEKHWQQLVDNPKLRPKPKLDVGEKKGEETPPASGTAPSDSKSTPPKKDETPPDRTKISTGRTEPNSLKEKLAMEEVKSNPMGTTPPRMPAMSDAKNDLFAKDGWVKRTQNVNGVEIHYVENVNTHETIDFKFKN